MDDNYLTPEGKLRRSQILQLAIHESRRRRRRRLVTPGVAAAVVIGVVVAVTSHRTPAPQASPAQAPPQVVAITPPEIQPASQVEIIASDPTITDRLTLAPQPRKWTAVDDNEFLNTLADAGQTAGIAYLNGKAILLHH